LKFENKVLEVILSNKFKNEYEKFLAREDLNSFGTSCCDILKPFGSEICEKCLETILLSKRCF
jgi:hypothetical protein